MGNYISYSKYDLIVSAALITAWLVIRPYFVALSKQAEAKNAERLEAEARLAESHPLRDGGSGSTSRRKKLD